MGVVRETQVRGTVSGRDGLIRPPDDLPQGLQRGALDEILSSPEKMKALLDSDTAKALMKKMGKQGP